MAKRAPPAHRIGREGRHLFCSRLPQEWIPRPEDGDDDYGIDYTVEIVNGEELTGLRCLVQLKSTESARWRANSLVLQVDVDDLLYWNSKQLATFLVQVDIKKSEFYWIEAHQLARAMTAQRGEEWKKQATVTISIPKQNTSGLAATLWPELARTEPGIIARARSEPLGPMDEKIITLQQAQLRLALVQGDDATIPPVRDDSLTINSPEELQDALTAASPKKEAFHSVRLEAAGMTLADRQDAKNLARALASSQGKVSLLIEGREQAGKSSFLALVAKEWLRHDGHRLLYFNERVASSWEHMSKILSDPHVLIVADFSDARCRFGLAGRFRQIWDSAERFVVVRRPEEPAKEGPTPGGTSLADEMQLIEQSYQTPQPLTAGTLRSGRFLLGTLAEGEWKDMVNSIAQRYELVVPDVREIIAKFSHRAPGETSGPDLGLLNLLFLALNSGRGNPERVDLKGHVQSSWAKSCLSDLPALLAGTTDKRIHEAINSLTNKFPPEVQWFLFHLAEIRRRGCSYFRNSEWHELTLKAMWESARKDTTAWSTLRDRLENLRFLSRTSAAPGPSVWHCSLRTEQLDFLAAERTVGRDTILSTANRLKELATEVEIGQAAWCELDAGLLLLHALNSDDKAGSFSAALRLLEAAEAHGVSSRLSYSEITASSLPGDLLGNEMWNRREEIAFVSEAWSAMREISSVSGRQLCSDAARRVLTNQLQEIGNRVQRGEKEPKNALGDVIHSFEYCVALLSGNSATNAVATVFALPAEWGLTPEECEGFLDDFIRAALPLGTTVSPSSKMWANAMAFALAMIGLEQSSDSTPSVRHAWMARIMAIGSRFAPEHPSGAYEFWRSQVAFTLKHIATYGPETVPIEDRARLCARIIDLAGVPAKEDPDGPHNYWMTVAGLTMVSIATDFRERFTVLARVQWMAVVEMLLSPLWGNPTSPTEHAAVRISTLTWLAGPGLVTGSAATATHYLAHLCWPSVPRAMRAEILPQVAGANRGSPGTPVGSTTRNGIVRAEYEAFMRLKHRRSRT